jgi:hypothetical protein
VAFELSEKTWKLGFTTGHGEKPRERTVAARHQARLLQEVAYAKKRFGLSQQIAGVEAERRTALQTLQEANIEKVRPLQHLRGIGINGHGC